VLPSGRRFRGRRDFAVSPANPKPFRCHVDVRELRLDTLADRRVKTKRRSLRPFAASSGYCDARSSRSAAERKAVTDERFLEAVVASDRTEPIKVTVKRGDTFINMAPPSIIKIDPEGFELDLKGMQ
jgi:hypothetical protein